MSQMGVVSTVAGRPPGNAGVPDCTAVTAWTFSRRLWSLVANAVAVLLASWATRAIVTRAIANKPKQVHGILVPLRLRRAPSCAYEGFVSISATAALSLITESWLTERAARSGHRSEVAGVFKDLYRSL